MPAGLVCCARKKIFRTLPLTSDNAHRDCLRSRHVAALVVMPERDQRVAFRVIRGAAALRDVVARRAQSVHLALDSVIREVARPTISPSLSRRRSMSLPLMNRIMRVPPR